MGIIKDGFLTYDPSDGSASQLTSQLSIQGSSATPDIWGLASLNGMLWALERGTDRLYIVDIANDVLIPVGADTLTEFGLPGSSNIQSFTAYKGELVAISNGLQKLVRFDQTTGIATLAANGTVPDAASEALAEHAGQLFLAGSGDDALFRMYDVGWDATIANLEVEEGANGSLDLSTVSDDAASFEFAPTHTARTWLTISGTELTITSAPAVTADTDFEGVVRAIRESAHEDKTVRVSVRDVAPPPSLNPPTFTEPATNYEVNERADDSIDSTEFFTGHTRLAFRSGYSAPSWLTISGLNVVITDAPDVLEDTDFTVPLTATNNDGSVNGSITISVQQIDPAPVFGTPNRFDIDEGSSSVFDLSGDLQNTESLAYQSGYSAPSWLTISGLTLVITNAQQVLQDTDFDVLLAAESTKTAATADRTVTIRVRDVAVPPPPPTDAVLDISVSPVSVTAGGIATVTFRFDKLVTGFTDSKVSVSTGATKGTLTDEGNNSWTMPITAPSSGSGTVTVSVGADVVSPGNNADSVVFAYTAPPPPPQTAMAPGAPQNVRVEITPTTAVLKWAAATEGGEADEYEVNVAEGASLWERTWIATGSTGTRFFVKRLKRGTQYTFGVRGRNSEGAGDASSPVTQNTPIASLHNALFFKECVNAFDNGGRVSEHGNPSNIIRAVADNDYKTFTREKDSGSISLSVGIRRGWMLFL